MGVMPCTTSGPHVATMLSWLLKYSKQWLAIINNAGVIADNQIACEHRRLGVPISSKRYK